MKKWINLLVYNLSVEFGDELQSIQPTVSGAMLKNYHLLVGRKFA